MNLAVLILHFGNPQNTLNCLSSLEKSDKTGIRLQIYLIDNGTGTDFGKKKNMILIRNEKNLGFAAGMNRGIDKAIKSGESDYFLLLNNDTVLPENFLQKLKITKYDITGAVVKYKSVNGKWIYDYGGLLNGWTGKTEHMEKTKYDPDPVNYKPDYFSGCCLMIKREAFVKIGLFDERFFFYYEDVDFCFRAKKAGLKLGLVPAAVIEHELSSSVGKWSNKAIYYNLSSHFKFINKHLGLKRPVAWIFLALLTAKIIWDKIFMKAK